MHIYLCFMLLCVFYVIQPFFVKCWAYIVLDRIQQVYSFYYIGCETNHDGMYCMGLYIRVVCVQYINDVITMLCTTTKIDWCRSRAYVNFCTQNTKFIVLHRPNVTLLVFFALQYTLYQCPIFHILSGILYIYTCHIYFQNSDLNAHFLISAMLFIFFNYG